MEKTQAGSRRYPRNSERAQDDRTVKWRTVDGKLLLDPGKKGVYSSYTQFTSELTHSVINAYKSQINGNECYFIAIDAFEFIYTRQSLKNCYNCLYTELLTGCMFCRHSRYEIEQALALPITLRTPLQKPMYRNWVARS